MIPLASTTRKPSPNLQSALLNALNWRYATKRFDPSKKVRAEDIALLKEALRLAPSSMGLQPWKFVLVSNPQMRKKLSAACMGQKQVEDASHVFVMCALKAPSPPHTNAYFDSISKTNPAPTTVGKTAQTAQLAGFRAMLEGYQLSMGPARTSQWYREQTYIALGFLHSACAQLGIDSCPIEGYDKAAVERLLGLEARGLQVCTVVPVGYRLASDAHAKDKKVRFDSKDVFIEM